MDEPSGSRSPLEAAPAVLMIRPAGFGYNPQTAPSNAFQRAPDPGEGDAAMAARREFDALAEALRKAGVQVLVFEDLPGGASSDAVFPNNWLSTHEDGTVVTYPMAAASRRSEVRADIVRELGERFLVSRHLDFTRHADEGRFLEGTGSLVLDRRARKAFACLSPRTDPGLLAVWAMALGYEPVSFEATDSDGQAIYHTNVMMSVGSTFALLCRETISAPTSRTLVEAALADSGHEIISITQAQMGAFVGNALQISSATGESVIALSEQARSALEPRQLATLERHGHIVSVPIPTIEHLGGGSVRCMLAELFLPPRT